VDSLMSSVEVEARAWVVAAVVVSWPEAWMEVWLAQEAAGYK